MKKIYQTIAILISFLFLAQLSFAQERTESLRDRLAKKQQQQTQQGVSVPKMSVRAQMMNAEQTLDISNATWMREVYRYLDLEKGRNGALYYPTRPIGDRMSLFTMIFKLMADDNLTVYDWQDGREIFTDEYKMKFEDVLERLEIRAEKNGNKYIYNEYDIPSNEVKGYYIKEVWYFDQSNSVLDVRVAAICPVLFRQDFSEFSESSYIAPERYPQFWIPYENIRPYAALMPALTSDLNNVLNKTIDDFFRLRLYDGEIYKVTNMENKILAEKYKTPEELKEAQAKIEKQLKDFDANLWVLKNDSTSASAATKKIKKAKTPKAKKIKSKSAGPAFSARDRR